MVFHDKIGEGNAPAEHLLSAHYLPATLFKKGPCSDGSVGGEDGRGAAALQPVTQGGGNAPAQIIPVNVQPVQIALVGHIGKAHDGVALLGHQGAVGQKRGVPPGKVHLSGGPDGQLLGGIVGGVHAVHRVIKQPCQHLHVGRLVGADLHRISPRSWASR